jgi:hypothetical protein
MLPITHRSRGLMLGALVALAAACDQPSDPTAPEPQTRPPTQLQTLECTANPRARTIACKQPGAPEGARGLLIGGQGQYVQLTSSNITYDDGTGSFQFDVTVQNLIFQPLGTTDGATPTAEGVRVFFHQAPVATSGTGSISVTADGQATFTGTNQDYFQYSGAELGGDGLLSQNETSSAQRWEMIIPSTVTTFAFNVAVAADVQFPDGYVELTPGVDTLVSGGTQQLGVTVRTAVGNVLLDDVSFGTSDAAVATVDGDGLVTAVGPGSVTITATSGPRTGTATLEICPDLAVGGVYTAVMPDASGICFAGGASGNAEYTYMPVNLSTSAALSLTLTGSGIVAVTGPPTPYRAPGTGTGLRSLDTSTLEAADALHATMLERDRALGQQLMARGDTRVQRGRGGRGPRALIVPGTPTVGDLWTLNVASGCSGTRDDRTGRVVSIGTHIIIVADTMNPPGGFTTAQYDSIRLEFDSLAYPVDTAAFGGPTDLDTNGRVVAFYTRAVNELSPPASSVVVNGFFSSRDLFSSAPTSCPKSNEGEMFYMLVPDPTGAVNSNVRTVSFVRGGTVGTMAHEFQHLINAARRVYINEAPGFEEVWLNEGLSHVAEELMFYRTSVGLAPRGNIIVTQLTTGPNASRRVAAFNSYANPNYGRLRSWLQRPDTAGAFKNTDVLAVRGVTWSFLRYAADRAGGTEATTWFNLVNSQTSGKANLQAVFGVDPDTWLRDYTAAMYADDAVAGVSPEYTNLSWSYRSIYGALNGSYQLVPRNLSNGTGLTLSYSRSGGTAYARFGVPTGGFAGITALSGGVAPTSPYALIVVRTK